MDHEGVYTELSHRLDTIGRARNQLKITAENHPEDHQLCVAAIQIITQLKRGKVVVIVVLLNGHGQGKESLGSGCRLVSHKTKSPAVKVRGLSNSPTHQHCTASTLSASTVMLCLSRS